jgi:hypothetical protein
MGLMVDKLLKPRKLQSSVPFFVSLWAREYGSSH